LLTLNIEILKKNLFLLNYFIFLETS